ncbi:MAG: hypothetical protein QOH90_1078, partial [Actinomycetota bacterium]|nr:hypothetical protein [Actinomycetota bacterium]
MDLGGLPGDSLPFFLLGPAVLSLLLLCARPGPPHLRRIAIRSASLVGILLAVGMAFQARDGSAWRGFLLARAPCLIAGVAIGCAWLLVAVRASVETRVERPALVGVAASALALTATTQWLVPLELFAVVLVVAFAASSSGRPRSPYASLAAGVGTAMVVAALASTWLDTDAWQVPTSLSDWQMWVALGGAGLLGGCIPWSGPWADGARPGSEASPLLVGAAFLFLLRIAPGEQVWVGAVVVVIGAAGFLLATRGRPTIGFSAPWPLVTGFAIALTVPSATSVAAVAAISAATVLLLAPSAR